MLRDDVFWRFVVLSRYRRARLSSTVKSWRAFNTSLQAEEERWTRKIHEGVGPKEKSHFHAKSVTCLHVWAGNPHGLLSGSGDKKIKLWNAYKGKFSRNFKGHTEVVTCLGSLDSDRAISGSADLTLRLWDSKGKPLRVLSGHTQAVTCLGTVTTNKVVSGSRDCTLKVWDAAQGKLLATLAVRLQVESPLTSRAIMKPSSPWR